MAWAKLRELKVPGLSSVSKASSPENSHSLELSNRGSVRWRNRRIRILYFSQTKKNVVMSETAEQDDLEETPEE